MLFISLIRHKRSGSFTQELTHAWYIKSVIDIRVCLQMACELLYMGLAVTVLINNIT